MNRSTKTRYVIFQILIEILKKNRNYETVFNQKITEFNFKQNEVSFINNVCLNTMRKQFHCKKILSNFTRKKLKVKEFLILSSAITQIFYLNIKPYAVVNEAVNIAKIIKVYPSFINAILKNILKETFNNKQIKLNYNDFPKWFVEQIKGNVNFDPDLFINTYHEQPSLHLVFKSKEALNNFSEPNTKTSPKSAFVENQKKISDMHRFKEGEWWVQDFSSMLPLTIIDNIQNLKILDLCAAPGGKAFQIISNNKVILNDISKKRILKLKENLKRLKHKVEIKNLNGLNFNEKNKYDIVVLDSPCSSIGTIRKHPEIFFKTNTPNFASLNKLQNSLLHKSSKLVKNKGKIIYMVCSFFHSETIEIINNFLKKNKNFKIEKYKLNTGLKNVKNLITKEGYFLTIPTKFKNHNIDGFFSAQLIKND